MTSHKFNIGNPHTKHCCQSDTGALELDSAATLHWLCSFTSITLLCSRDGCQPACTNAPEWLGRGVALALRRAGSARQWPNRRPTSTPPTQPTKKSKFSFRLPKRVHAVVQLTLPAVGDNLPPPYTTSKSETSTGYFKGDITSPAQFYHRLERCYTDD